MTLYIAGSPFASLVRVTQRWSCSQATHPWNYAVVSFQKSFWYTGVGIIQNTFDLFNFGSNIKQWLMTFYTNRLTTLLSIIDTALARKVVRKKRMRQSPEIIHSTAGCICDVFFPYLLVKYAKSMYLSNYLYGFSTAIIFYWLHLT